MPNLVLGKTLLSLAIVLHVCLQSQSPVAPLIKLLAQFVAHDGLRFCFLHWRIESLDRHRLLLLRR